MHIGIARHFAQRRFLERTQQSAPQWLNVEVIHVPQQPDVLMRGARHALVGHGLYPLAELGVEVGQTRRFSALQATQALRRTYFTPDSILPFVLARYGRHNRGRKPQ